MREKLSSIKRKMDIHLNDAREFSEDFVGLVGIDMARVSDCLLVQLYGFAMGQSRDVFSVSDVMQGVEGRRPGICSKPGEPFRHDTLSGFWKAHVSDAHDISCNLVLELPKKDEAMCNTIRDLEKEEAQNPSKNGMPGRLAQTVVDGYEKRAERKALTGDWIIYGKHESKNYYLAVAEHARTKEEDEELYQRLNALCGAQFPFLFTR